MHNLQLLIRKVYLPVHQLKFKRKTTKKIMKNEHDMFFSANFDYDWAMFGA